MNIHNLSSILAFVGILGLGSAVAGPLNLVLLVSGLLLTIIAVIVNFSRFILNSIRSAWIITSIGVKTFWNRKSIIDWSGFLFTLLLLFSWWSITSEEPDLID